MRAPMAIFKPNAKSVDKKLSFQPAKFAGYPILVDSSKNK